MKIQHRDTEQSDEADARGDAEGYAAQKQSQDATHGRQRNASEYENGLAQRTERREEQQEDQQQRQRHHDHESA